MLITDFISKIRTNYIKKLPKTKEDIKKLEYINELKCLNSRLKIIQSDFEYIVDEDLIDALIYEEQGIYARLSYLYKQAKQEKIKIEFFDYEL